MIAYDMIVLTVVYRITGKFGEFGELSVIHQTKTIQLKLDGFSLVNHGQFAKFAKLSPHQTFPLYGILQLKQSCRMLS